MPNDFKIENEEFWYEPLDDFQSYGEIVVVDIKEEDLLSENSNGLQEKGSVDYGEWEELATLINKEEVQLHKEDFAGEDADPTEWVVLLYTGDRYVTCISG